MVRWVSAGLLWCASQSRTVSPRVLRHSALPASRTVSLMSSTERRLAVQTRSRNGSISAKRRPESSSASAEAADCRDRHVREPHSVSRSSMTAAKCASTAALGSSTTACQMPLTASCIFGLGSCCMR